MHLPDCSHLLTLCNPDNKHEYLAATAIRPNETANS